MTAKRPLAYITAAWSGNRTADRERAAQYCRQVYEAGYSPLCPMLFLPVFLHESIPKEHKDGLDMARECGTRPGTMLCDDTKARASLCD